LARSTSISTGDRSSFGANLSSSAFQIRCASPSGKASVSPALRTEYIATLPSIAIVSAAAALLFLSAASRASPVAAATSAIVVGRFASPSNACLQPWALPVALIDIHHIRYLPPVPSNVGTLAVLFVSVMMY